MATQTRRWLGDDAGAAVVGALMVMLLMAGITAGFTALVITDTKVRSLDSTRTQSFYAVHAGLEKLTADLGDLFSTNVAPTAAQINALTSSPPSLGVTWQQPDGTNGYRITFPTGSGGNPVATVMTVDNGPFQGLVGLATPYVMTVTGRVADRSETSLTRTLQTVAIPVFQFGIFSEQDLSYFAGPDFSFGGRVHCNGNLFLCHFTGNQLTLKDRVTSVGEIIRTHMSNGYDVTGGLQGDVRVSTAPGSYRNLARTEGTLVGTLGSARNEPTWTNLSTGDYNHRIMSGRTGARRLDLPITQFGALPIDLIKRPVVGENTSAPMVLAERFYSLASLRILLSDTAAEITNLPGIVSGTPPIALGTALPSGYTTSSGTNGRAPFAATPASATGLKVPNGTPLLGGFLKIEKQNSAGVWSDVTLEILNLGIDSPAYRSAGTNPAMCPDINPNAILRLQRGLDSSGSTGSTPWNCYTTANLTTDGVPAASVRHVPQVLFDAREGTIRDTAQTSMQFSGIIHYIELDVRNLSRWFTGAIGTTGTQAWNLNGYTVYFSDRRGNKNSSGVETGEFGYEDIVNPASSTGAPNASLNTGEDLNGNGSLDTYGKTARLPYGLSSWTNVLSPLGPSATPETMVGTTNPVEIARRNPLIFFRRALKLTNGALGNIVSPGLTIASENAVYIQGNWNANNSGFGDPHVATAVLADSVTMLSNAWSDLNSLTYPYTKNETGTQRTATNTWYRVAIVGGKGLSFPQPSGTTMYYGTDGGVHNFLRYIEDWGAASGIPERALNYRGSLVSLYTSRQAVGIYKCCAVVYDPPERAYAFDEDFLTPALLPPRTPMFRDVNITGFSQIIRP